VGIPLAEQPHIWEQFYQAPGAEVQSGSQVGVGMGLYISKALVEGHHGRVGVASAPGRGTTLWFTLPLVSPPAASAPEEDAYRPASLPVPNDHAPAQDGRTT
jgi:signal transduction histidine kinase